MSPSMTACIVVVVSCLGWVGLISWVLTYFLGLTAAMGWLLAGTLGLSTVAAAGVILYELRHAMDLTDWVEEWEFEGMRDLPWERGMPHVAAHA